MMTKMGDLIKTDQPTTSQGCIMADTKNKDFHVRDEIKTDKRLTGILKRMNVIDSEEVENKISNLKDSESNKRVVSMEQISKAK